MHNYLLLYVALAVLFLASLFALYFAHFVLFMTWLIGDVGALVFLQLRRGGAPGPATGLATGAMTRAEKEHLCI